MTILAAHYVHRPRWGYRCDDCGQLLGPHIYLYGRASEADRFSAMRLCVAHCVESRDPKVIAAAAAAAAAAPAVAGEREQLAAWNNAEPIRDGGPAPELRGEP